jgi:hypothetical protein
MSCLWPKRLWGLRAILRASALAVVVLASATGQAGVWRAEEGTVPLTGGRSITASEESVKPLANMLGVPEPATLVLRCNEGVLSTYVVWPQVLSMDVGDQTMVLWRVDDEKIAINFWDRSTDGTAAGKFATGGAMKLIRKISELAKSMMMSSGCGTNSGSRSPRAPPDRLIQLE